MATYTLRIIQNGKGKSGTFTDNQRAQLPADPNTEYRIYDENGNLITHPVVERQGDDLLVYANKVNDGEPELILTDYFNKRPVLNADYVADAGNTLMTSDKLAAIVPVVASEVLVKAITVGAALVIGGVILSLFDDDDSKGGISVALPDTSISTPEITINDVPDMQKGKVADTITLSGSLNNIDPDATATVMVSIDGQPAQQAKVEGNIWTLEVNGADLAATTGAHAVSAIVVATDNAGNTATGNTATDDYNVLAADLVTPTITIAPIAPITNKDGTTTLTGTVDLKNEGVEEAIVTVTANGKEYTATVSGNTWTLTDVPNSELAQTEGDTPITATVTIFKDGVSQSATNADNAETPVSDTDNIVKFVVDTTVSQPDITINDVPNIEKGKEEASYTLSGSLKNIDADATPTVTVTVNGTAITTPVTISADKAAWSVDVSGSLLAEKVGDNQKVTASVSVVDANGNTASSEQAVEDAYNVTEAPTIVPAELNTPYITVTPLAEINDKNGKTTLTGKLDLNNENLDSETVTVSINGGEPVIAQISDDKQSWTLEVDNATLIGDENAPHTIVATVDIAKGDQTAQNTNTENDRDTDPSVNNGNFTVDNHVNTPEITINDVPNIEKGKEEASYTLSGSLKNIDADATPTVTVTVNGTAITTPVTISADKKTWSVNVSGSLLAEKVGDNQKVTASVSVVDANGNTASSKQAVEDAYNVTEAPTVVPAELNTPYITVTPLAEINDKNGKTTLTGKLDLNNENLDSETVTVSINGGEPVIAQISDDKQSWTLEVDNAALIGDENAPHTIVATVDIAKGDQTAQNTNTENDRDTDPSVNNGNFTVDNHVNTPEITINDVPNIEKGKEEASYTLSGSLKNIDADATPTVTVTVNGTAITTPVTISADKATWSAVVAGSLLAEKAGEKQPITATVNVEDKMGNTATAEKPAETAYNVTEPAPVTPTALNEPYITVTPIAPITQANKDGKTTLTGKLDLNNENLDSETVTVSINGGEPVTAKISDDKQSWTLEVDNATLIGNADTPQHTILATVDIAKGDQTAQNTNVENDRDTDPAVNTADFVVDIDISTPSITINDVPNIEQGKEEASYTLSGTLDNIDADATPTVTVTVNGTAITTPVTISADKKTWSVDVSGSELAKTVGDNQKVTATVSVEDEVGNTAEAATPAEDSYNVTAAAPVEPSITIDAIAHDEINVNWVVADMLGQPTVKTLSGSLTNVGNNATVEITVNAKPYEVQIDGDKWTINIPAKDLTQKGVREIVATVKVADATGKEIAYTDTANFFVIDPSITITSPIPTIKDSSGTTIISGTFEADGADRKVITLNIGDMVNDPATGQETKYVNTVTSYSSDDANSKIQINEAAKTWSMEVDNSVLAHMKDSSLGVQAQIQVFETYPNGEQNAVASTSEPYQSDVVAPQSSPYLISDLVDDDSSTLAAISSVIDVSAAENHSVSGSNGVQDTFVFSKVLDGSIAQIANFNADEDKLQLNSEVFTALSNTMSDFADYVQYNAATGALSYDADGTGAGAATQLAQLSKDLEIDQSNFIIA